LPFCAVFKASTLKASKIIFYVFVKSIIALVCLLNYNNFEFIFRVGNQEQLKSLFMSFVKSIIAFWVLDL
jgi:hypothetical protein